MPSSRQANSISLANLEAAFRDTLNVCRFILEEIKNSHASQSRGTDVGSASIENTEAGVVRTLLVHSMLLLNLGMSVSEVRRALDVAMEVCM